MKIFYNHIYILYATVLIVHLLNVFIESSILSQYLSYSAIIMFLLAFIKSSIIFKSLGTIFIVLGMLFYSTTSSPIIDIIYVLQSNFPVLTFLIMLPWMNSVVRSGKYDYLLSKIMKMNTKNLGTLYNRSALSTFSLATFINLPAITISQDIIKSNLNKFSKRIRNHFINKASVRSYTIALLWSPLEMIVVVGIFVTGVKYIQVLPWLLLIVISVFFFDNIIGKLKYRQYAYSTEKSDQTYTKNDIKKIIGLVGALTFFLSMIVLAGYFEKIDFIITITIIILPFSLIWAFYFI